MGKSGDGVDAVAVVDGQRVQDLLPAVFDPGSARVGGRSTAWEATPQGEPPGICPWLDFTGCARSRAARPAAARARGGYVAIAPRWRQGAAVRVRRRRGRRRRSDRVCRATRPAHSAEKPRSFSAASAQRRFKPSRSTNATTSTKSGACARSNKANSLSTANSSSERSGRTDQARRGGCGPSAARSTSVVSSSSRADKRANPWLTCARSTPRPAEINAASMAAASTSTSSADGPK